MVICDFELSGIEIPKSVLRAGKKQIQIDISDEAIPNKCSADVWIATACAIPHIDNNEHSRGLMLVTLCVSGAHELSDAISIRGKLIEKGSLFIIDPGVCHWMFDTGNFYSNKKQRSFIGLQWEVKRNELGKKLGEIIKEIESFSDSKAVFRNHIDDRYKDLVTS